MTGSKLRTAMIVYAALAALAWPLDAPIPGSQFQVRHLVWILMAGLAVKTWLAQHRGGD